MTSYSPDGWVIIQLGESDYRVFGSWRGGYLTGDSWRVNSGIVDVVELSDGFLVYGESGSVYECYKGAYYKLGPYNESVVSGIVQAQISEGFSNFARVLSEDEAVVVLRKFVKQEVE